MVRSDSEEDSYDEPSSDDHSSSSDKSSASTPQIKNATPKDDDNYPVDHKDDDSDPQDESDSLSVAPYYPATNNFSESISHL